MGDVAHILGVNSGGRRQSGAPPPPLPASHQPSRAQQLQGMSKQVLDIIGASTRNRNNDENYNNSLDLPPITPTSDIVKVGNKNISKSKPARPWIWAPFVSSSRTDGAIFYHWVRANVEYPDYPYARFDVHLDPVLYTDEEYDRHLTSSSWTKSETDQLMDFARKFELRWPVIHDRWVGECYDNNEPLPDDRNIEDLQHRYYQVAVVLNQSRISQQAASEVQALTDTATNLANDALTTPEEKEKAAEGLLLETAAARSLASADPVHQPIMSNLGTGSTNKPAFDLVHERQRRAHWEAIWKRSKQEEEEETALRLELKQVETQLRKLKKKGGHIIAAAKAAGVNSNNKSAASSRTPSRSVSPVPGGAASTDPTIMVNNAMSAIVPTPTPGFPYLQSGRLAPPAAGGSSGINKAVLNRMHALLAEMDAPSQPIATKRVCDVYDTVRQDALKLLILQKNLLQKEGLVESKRLKLAKMGGNVRVVQEETLLGIALAPVAAPSSTAAANTASGASRPKTQRPKAKSTGTSKSKSGASGSTNKKSSSEAKSKKVSTEPSADETVDAATTADDTETAKEVSKPTKKKVVKRKRKVDATKPSASSKPSAATDAPVPAATPAAKGTSDGGTKTPGKKRLKKG